MKFVVMLLVAINIFAGDGAVAGNGRVINPSELGNFVVGDGSGGLSKDALFNRILKIKNDLKNNNLNQNDGSGGDLLDLTHGGELWNLEGSTAGGSGKFSDVIGGGGGHGKIIFNGLSQGKHLAILSGVNSNDFSLREIVVIDELKKTTESLKRKDHDTKRSTLDLLISQDEITNIEYDIHLN